MFNNISNTHEQGNIGLTAAIHRLTIMGFTVCLPINDTQYFDLVIVDTQTGKCSTVQVKTTQHKPNESYYHVSLVTSGGTRKNNTKKFFSENNSDYLFVLVEDGTEYFIPRDLITVEVALSLNTNWNNYIVNGLPVEPHVNKNQYFDKENVYTGYCIDCGEDVGKGATRCRKCSRIHSKKIEWPSLATLKDMVDETSKANVARVLGVSESAIRNRLRDK